jgi:uncharacterized protein DUF2188
VASVAIHIVPDDAFDDWVVREDGGRELGHFPTREAAEVVAREIARKCEGTLVIELPDGRRECTSFAKSWLDRWLAR